MIRIEAPGHPVWIGRGGIDRLRRLLPPARRFIVTDVNVAKAGWADRAAAGLDGTIGLHVVPAGEASKSLERLGILLDALLEARIGRGDQVVAVGGGVVGDLAGLAAAIVKRGCGFVPVPTTLLAQADSAIGGKTAINARQGKNLIGAFHRPAAVVIDIAALETLPAGELRAGYAEVVKYGLIGDADFFAWCESHGGVLIEGDDDVRLRAIESCVRAKAAIVAADERDISGRRALLNFGHSFAHALESETGLAHGEAVAIGMAMAFRLSVRRGLCPPEDAARVEAHLASVGLPIRPDGGVPARLLRALAHDKKSRDGRLRLVLARRIGEVFLDDSVRPDELETFLKSEAASAGLAVG